MIQASTRHLAKLVVFIGVPRLYQERYRYVFYGVKWKWHACKRYIYSDVLINERQGYIDSSFWDNRTISPLQTFFFFLFVRLQDSPLAARWIIGRLVSLSDLSSMAKMSVVGGRERLALLCLAGVKGGSGLEFQLNTSYMDEDILISANKPFNAATLGYFPIESLFFFFFFRSFLLSFFLILSSQGWARVGFVFWNK